MLTIKEVSQFTGLKPQAIRKRYYRNTITAIKRGRDLFISEEQFIALVEDLKKKKKF